MESLETFQSNENKDFENKVNENKTEEINIHSTTIEREPINISSSTLSLDSEASHTNTPHYMHSYPNLPYPYPPYAWCPPTAHADGCNTNWYYPYQMPSIDANNQGAFTQQSHIPVYPYFYPFYPPHYPQPTLQQSPYISSYPPPYATPYPVYPYPVAPSQSQSSNSSRASSVLPDIIVTPSTDDKPSQVILQHHIKVEKQDSSKNSGYVQIEELNDNLYNENQCRSHREGSVVDLLTRRLEDMSKENLNTRKSNEKLYTGKSVEDFEQKSPVVNTFSISQQVNSPMVEDVEDIAVSDNEDDSDETPKYHKENVVPGLQAIRSVANIKIYQNAQNIEEVNDNSDSETTCDGESEIFDEDDNADEELVVVEDYEVEDQDTDDLIEDDNLSIIYEEESELEGSSGLQQTSKLTNANASELETIGDQRISNAIEEVHESTTEDTNDEETSVTVRLPLKFSFDDDERITTVEVGNSQIEEKRNSITSSGKKSSFSIAEIEDESDTDECEVSVTISLSNSSLSNSSEPKHFVGEKVSEAYPLEDMQIPCEKNNKNSSSSSEDLSATFSLCMRNKFLGQTLGDCATNNIAADLPSDDAETSCAKTLKENKCSNDNNNLDFFETLRATKLQAQKIMEQSTNLWGKPNNNKLNTTLEFQIHEAEKNSNKVYEDNTEDIDFWALIEDSKQDNGWKLKEKSLTCTSMTLERIQEIQNLAPTLHFCINDLLKSQNAEICFLEIPTVEQDDEIDIWASIENARNIVSEPIATAPEEPSDRPNEPPLWKETKNYEQYDPIQFPSEPREVDTDEEIDFWAEIEANKSSDKDNSVDNDVNFFQASSFWVNRERQNSLDETPYKPVLPKAFPSRLPSETNTVNIDSWSAALEAARGEEPIIIDPDDDESKATIVNLLESQLELQNETHNLRGNCEQPSSPNRGSSLENIFSDAKYIEEKDSNNDKFEVKSKEKDELEVKRNNYRQAMAFFKTSIDENSRDQVIERRKKNGRHANRNSMIVENQTPMPCMSFRKTRSNENLVAACEQATGNMAYNTLLPNLESELPQISLTTNNTSSTDIFVEPKLPPTELLLKTLPNLGIDKHSAQQKLSVRERISAFETVNAENAETKKLDLQSHSLSVESCTPKSSLSRNSSTQRSESEMEEDDSGVTDMNKPLSETDTESESFPELRKMSSYQRAATHSRLFKLLQDENELLEDLNQNEEYQLKPSRRKIIHNVSITRKQNPKAISEAETMTQRRERLSLPLRKNTSIDADNPSTPNSPASPILNNAATNKAVSDKLVNELVQSLLLKSDGRNLKNIPMSKLQAAAKRVLEEEIDSLENTSVDNTPNDGGKQEKNYIDYYNTWSDASGSNEVIPSKSFRALQETNRRSPWSARCPRVLSSKTVNRDLARVTESPEIPARSSRSPECFSRENSVSRRRKL